MKENIPMVEAQMLIRKPVSSVFQAFIDPQITSRFWFTKSSGERINVAEITQAEMKPLRREMRMIFQDPFASLDPRKTAGHSVAEPLVIHGIGNADIECYQITSRSHDHEPGCRIGSGRDKKRYKGLIC